MIDDIIRFYHELTPIIEWAVIASFLVGFCLPWVVESKVPMEEWGNWKFVLTIYCIACLAGMAVGLTIWHDVTALVMWVPALVAQVARQVLSQWKPWFSPRKQTILKIGADGRIGIKEGDNPTLYGVALQTDKAPAQPGSESETPK